jgi:hypothetical protein
MELRTGRGDVLDRAEVAVRDMDGGLSGRHQARRADCRAVRVVAQQEVVVALFIGQTEIVQNLVEQVLVGMAHVQVELVGTGRVHGVRESDRLRVIRVADQVEVDVQLVP